MSTHTVRLFQSLLFGSSLALIGACSDDDVPICYPDADVTCGPTNTSDAGGIGGTGDTGDGSGDSCGALTGSCLFTGDEETTCSEFYGSAAQGAALQRACEDEQQGSWGSGACDTRGSFNVGCRTDAGGFCTTAWYNAATEDVQTANDGCTIAGGTPQ